MAKGHENIVPPKKGERRNPNGRPKKFVSAVLDSIKAEGYEEVTQSQVKQIYMTLIALPNSRLKAIDNEEDMPTIYKIVAKAVLSKKGFEIIERMLDRAHGKAMQKTEHSGEVSTPTIVSVRTEELDDFLEKLKERENGRTKL